MLERTLLIFLLIFTLVRCRSVKSGVFDNVTVHLQGLDKISTEDVIFIDYDDTLSNHVRDKPSAIIIIRNQIVPKLETNSLSNLLQVQKLILTNNGIREVQRGTFKNVPNLKLLNLSHNAIEEVGHGVFNGLPLEELYLDHNKILRIGYKAFANLHTKNLFLSHNRIQRWSKDWLTDSSVMVLDVGFNLIEDLPSNSFQSMANTVNMSVFFTSNRLRKINGNVFRGMKSFKSIFFDSNSIEDLHVDAFKGVKYINTLNLNNNSIFSINVNLFKATRVDVLMVEDNKLPCISTDIFHMEELDVDGNPITCYCVRTWLEWRNVYSNPSIYHISNLEEECL